jgi:putative hemolysin
MTNVLNLDERHVSSALTPRSDVVYLDVQDPLERNLDKLRRDPHDVLPLCEGDLDHILGIVRARRILEEALGGRRMDLAALAEPALFVPETMTLMTLLEQLRRARLTAALVVDEFGQVQGIASLTDVIASIVGELPTGTEPEPTIVRRDDGSWLLDGTLDLDTVVRALKDDSFLDPAARQQYHTLGGLAMVSLRRVPRTGDVFERGGYRFEIVDMDGNRVDRVLVSRTAASDGRQAEPLD